MIDTAVIRKRVLELAYQGNLSEQLASDGDIESLYNNIRHFVGANELPVVDEEEKYIEIPDTWKWVRIGSVAKINPKNDLEDYLDSSFVPMALVTEGFKNSHTHEVIQWGKIKKGFNHFREGDIGVAKITPCFQNRKSVVFKNLYSGFGACTTELLVLRTNEELLMAEYLLYYFKTEWFITKGVESFTGVVGQQRIHKDYLKTSPMPLPPYAEQQRIVKKIKETFALLDTIDTLQTQYSSDLEILKAKIIEAGIQGKLTEQLSEDRTAEELLEQIAEEKMQLVKEKKIKTSKPLPEITEDEIPFKIPENWKWVVFEEISNIVGTGLIRSSQEQFDDADYYYFKMNNIENFTGKCDFNNMTMVNATDEEYERYKLNEGDFLFNTRNSAELVGKTAVVHNAPTDRILLNNNILKIMFYAGINPDYINYFFISRSGRRQLEQFITSTTNVAAIYQRQIVTLSVPLPPVEEQNRIVSQIESFLAVI